MMIIISIKYQQIDDEQPYSTRHDNNVSSMKRTVWIHGVIKWLLLLWLLARLPFRQSPLLASSYIF